MVGGSRVLGEADPNHAARELGVKLFAQLLSLLTWSKVTDPACGYRAVRTEALRGLLAIRVVVRSGPGVAARDVQRRRKRPGLGIAVGFLGDVRTVRPRRESSSSGDAETIAQPSPASGRGSSGRNGASACASPAGSPSNSALRCCTRLTW